MSALHPTHELLVPPMPGRRRKPTASLLALVLAALVVAGLIGVLLTQVSRGSDHTAAIAGEGAVVEIAEPVVVDPLIPDTGDGSGAPVPAGPGVVDPTPEATGQVVEPTAAPTVAATAGPEATATPVAPAPQPGDDLTDEEEDLLEAGPDGADVPDGEPAAPAEEVDPAPSEPLPPVELEPVEGEQPVDNPCLAVLAEGENLLVEDPIVLDKGVLSSAVTIHNCGAAPVDWTAATKPWVALASANGNLGAGSTTELAFDVDRDAVDAGAFEFRIKVSEPGANTYVDVSGFRATVGSDHVATDQLTAGPGSGGCANSCIRKAELTSNATSPDVFLDVETTVPAAINVWVSTNAPVPNGNGDPSLPGVGLKAFSNGQVTQFGATLGGLQPATKYHIVVEATDNNGKSTVEAGTFTTVTPVQLPDGFVAPGPGGCANQCITKAVLSFGADPTNLSIDVEATTAAHLIASVSPQAPVYSGGKPTFAAITASAASNGFVTDWDANVTGLAAGTDYHIIVQATDENGHTAHQVGEFSTPAAPVADHTVDLVVVPLRLTVTNDGDNIGRGELSFAWAVGDHVDTRGEQRMSDGDSFNFPFYSQYHFQDVATDSFLPQITVTAFERDPDGKVEFNALGAGPIRIPDHGHLDPADQKYNTAVAGLNIVGNHDAMARCSSFGITGAWANYPCEQISTVGYGDDYPEFRAIIAYQVAADIPQPVPGG